MIKEFVDLVGGDKATQITQTLKAIEASNNTAAETIKGVLGMSLADFGSIQMNLTISHQATITHGLNYTPVFLAYFYSSAVNQYILLPVIDYGNAFTGLESRSPASVLTAWVDNINLYIKWDGSAQTPNQEFFYFIFKAQVGATS